ncbi:MAG: dihydrolipoyl dehydrogenase [Firmicutes bacterium]|nr:dihydrolipoyl dehydrogenase [Bacillota bacterium]
MSEKYQLVIIGGGPGGYLAALRAGSLGLKTAVIEKEALGGVCLNHGCIPTKVLTHGAAMNRRLHTADQFGFTFNELKFSYPILQAKKKAVVSELVGHIGELMENSKISVYFGIARATSPKKVSVKLHNDEELELETENIILATGSDEIIPPTPGLELPGIMTSREALALEELPATMAVIGGGVIALEMASIFMGLGVKVTIVHRSERLLRRMDLEMVRRLSTYLRKSGLEIMMNSPIKVIEKTDSGYRLKVDGKKGEELVEAKSVLLAVGRKPAFGDQDLDVLGVKYEKDGIRVNSKMETSVSGVYAVGDVTYPGYYLAHTAFHQGIVAAENIAGLEAHFDGTAVPSCLYTDPELASVGISEEEAKEKGLENIKSGKFPFSACGRAATQDELDGLVKIIAAGEDEKVVGMHILGAHASELIQEGTLAVAKGVKAAELAKLIHPHPTMNEAVWEAAMAVNKTSLHITRR